MNIYTNAFMNNDIVFNYLINFIKIIDYITYSKD